MVNRGQTLIGTLSICWSGYLKPDAKRTKKPEAKKQRRKEEKKKRKKPEAKKQRRKEAGSKRDKRASRQRKSKRRRREILVTPMRILATSSNAQEEKGGRY